MARVHAEAMLDERKVNMFLFAETMALWGQRCLCHSKAFFLPTQQCQGHGLGMFCFEQQTIQSILFQYINITMFKHVEERTANWPGGLSNYNGFPRSRYIALSEQAEP